jgi:hypothetical protein
VVRLCLFETQSGVRPLTPARWHWVGRCAASACRSRVRPHPLRGRIPLRLSEPSACRPGDLAQAAAVYADAPLMVLLGLIALSDRNDGQPSEAPTWNSGASPPTAQMMETARLSGSATSLAPARMLWSGSRPPIPSGHLPRQSPGAGDRAPDRAAPA